MLYCSQQTMKTRMNTRKSEEGAKFSERLKIAMKRRGMTRPVDLFKALVDNGYEGRYQTVINWLDGRHAAQLNHVCMIARALGCRVDFFVS